MCSINFLSVTLRENMAVRLLILFFFAPYCWEYESKIFPSNRSVFLPEVCQSSSHKQANIGCSRVWLSNFYSSNCFKFAVDCDWNCKISQNVPNSGFFSQIDRCFEKKSRFLGIAKGSKFAVECDCNSEISQNVTNSGFFLKIR